MLTRIDVPARSHPRAEHTMAVEHDPAPTDDHRRNGDVDRSPLVERVGTELVELDQEALDAAPFTFVDGYTRPYRRPNLVPDVVQLPARPSNQRTGTVSVLTTSSPELKG